MHTFTRRAVFGMAAALAGAVILVSCSAGKGSAVTALQERDRLLQVVDDTAAQLPGHT